MWSAIAILSSGCAPAAVEVQTVAPPTAAPPQQAQSPQAAKAAIDAVLDDWHLAAARADETRYFDHMADDAVFLGTDATERWNKEAFRAYAHPYFAKGKAWSFRAQRRVIAIGPGGAIAWFDEDLETGNLGPARGSGVLVLQQGTWRIAHYNLAITVPNDRFDAVKKAAAGEGNTAVQK